MIISDPKSHRPDNAKVAQLQAYINANPRASFKQLRVDETDFAGLNDGEIHQIALDAGFEVHPEHTAAAGQT